MSANQWADSCVRSAPLSGIPCKHIRIVFGHRYSAALYLSIVGVVISM